MGDGHVPSMTEKSHRSCRSKWSRIMREIPICNLLGRSLAASVEISLVHSLLHQSTVPSGPGKCLTFLDHDAFSSCFPSTSPLLSFPTLLSSLLLSWLPPSLLFLLLPFPPGFLSHFIFKCSFTFLGISGGKEREVASYLLSPISTGLLLPHHGDVVL